MGMLVLIRNLRFQMKRNPIPPKYGSQFIVVVQRRKYVTNLVCSRCAKRQHGHLILTSVGSGLSQFLRLPNHYLVTTLKKHF